MNLLWGVWAERVIGGLTEARIREASMVVFETVKFPTYCRHPNLSPSLSVKHVIHAFTGIMSCGSLKIVPSFASWLQNTMKKDMDPMMASTLTRIFRHCNRTKYFTFCHVRTFSLVLALLSEP